MAIIPGARLGPYEILSAIGAGGMGEVYRARDTRLNRDVALKVIPEVFASNADRMGRYEREAKLLASLNHPHIAAIYGLEESGSTNALVMEMVEGPTLADRIALGTIPLDEALPIAKQIAEALEYAHDHGVIHRDLKPANIKVKPDGTVKVLDFGLAKALLDEPEGADLRNSPTISMAATMAGTILGTAAYMSPEQAKGKPVDRRADIWAFGVVLFEMLTGQPLFAGETAAETLASVIKEEPSFERLPSVTPSAIRNLLRRCLEKDVKRRLQHIGEARIVIEDVLSGVASAEPAMTQRKSREQILMVVAAVAVVLSLALSATLLSQKPDPKMPLEATLLPPKDHSFYGSLFALSPDGKKIAFAAIDSITGTRMLWIRSLDSTAAQPLAGTDDATGSFWSPDSKFVGFVVSNGQGRQLKKISASGGPVITLVADAGGAIRGTWGVDGTIVFSRGVPGGLYEVSSDGGPVSELTHPDAKRGEDQHRWAFFLPDGRHLLFEAVVADQMQGGTANETRVLDLKTKKQSIVLRADSNAQFANGYLVFVQQGNLMAQSFDLSSPSVSGSPVLIAEQVQADANAMGAFSAGPSGLLAFQAGSGVNSQLVLYTRDGKETGQVGSPGEYNVPVLSPDGSKAAVSLGQGSKRDIWVFELARGVATRVTVDGGGANFPIWTRDGNRVIYAGTERGTGIYSKAPSGLGGSDLVERFAREAVTISSFQAMPNSISPDGKFLVYMNFVSGATPRLWIHPFAAGNPDAKDYPLLGTNFAEAHAQFSPDGHWLAYSSEETGRGEIYIVPFPSLSSKLQISTSGGFQPRWRRDGKEIYYVAPDGKMMAVAIAISGNALKPDTPKALFQTRIVTSSRGYHQYDVTADGQRFLINSNVQQNPEPITLYVNWTAGLKK